MLRPTVRSPRVRTITFLSSICRIYSTILEQHWASSCVVDSPELCEPSIRFVFLRPRVCHRASFRFSAIGRMSFWLTPRGGHPCRRLMVGAVYLHSGLSPPSYCPCRAHNEKRPAGWLGVLFETGTDADRPSIVSSQRDQCSEEFASDNVVV